MKKLLIMAVAAAFTLTSCEDFLDSENYTKANTGNFPSLASDLDYELTGAYSVLNQYCNTPLNNPYFIWNLMSDDCNGGGGTGDVEAHAVGHIVQNDDGLYAPAWNATYAGINRTSTIIYSVDAMDWKGQEATRDQLLGEAFFLRGLYYLWGTQLFGDIPAYWQAGVPTPCPQVSAEEVIYPHILADFLSAYKLMNKKTQGDGHATKYAAAAMLARAYMFYEGFYKKAGELKSANLADVELPEQEGVEGALTKAQVVAALEDVIKNGGYSLVDDYRNLWQYTNELTVEDYDFTKGQGLKWAGNGNSEQLFQIQFMNIASWQGNVSMGFVNELSLYSGLRCDDDAAGEIDPARNATYCNGYQNTFPFGQGWGQGTVQATLWDDWSNADPRKKASVLDAQEECDHFVFTTSCSEDAGYYNKKLLPVTTKNSNQADMGSYYTWWSQLQDGYTNTNGNSMQGDHFADLILIRLADVYLMHAELTGDKTYLNKVQERAGVAQTDYSLDVIKNERRYELAFEGLRFNDLRRWSGKNGGASSEAARALERQNGSRVNYTGRWSQMKHATSSWAQRYAETDGFLMIPQSEIDKVGNPEVLKQNAGWDSNATDASIATTPVY
ncbi:MAG: RagB/SusD family nutrient uptake outer membrane protein [Prevotella sp.]|nr:RagB/SusD family nutrient uptake outer membrane protein [Prevotella sp.]